MQHPRNKIRFTLLPWLPIVWPPAGSQVDPYAPEMPLTTLNIPHHVVICTHHPAPRLLRNVVLTWYWPGNVVLWWWSPSWWFGLMPCKCWSDLLQILHYSSMWIKAKPSVPKNPKAASVNCNLPSSQLFCCESKKTPKKPSTVSLLLWGERQTSPLGDVYMPRLPCHTMAYHAIPYRNLPCHATFTCHVPTAPLQWKKRAGRQKWV